MAETNISKFPEHFRVHASTSNTENSRNPGGWDSVRFSSLDLLCMPLQFDPAGLQALAIQPSACNPPSRLAESTG